VAIPSIFFTGECIGLSVALGLVPMLDEPEEIKVLLSLPTMLDMIDPNEEDTVGNLSARITCGIGESGNLALHPFTSWLGGA
jgi:hypothetical protein